MGKQSMSRCRALEWAFYRGIIPHPWVSQANGFELGSKTWFDIKILGSTLRLQEDILVPLRFPCYNDKKCIFSAHSDPSKTPPNLLSVSIKTNAQIPDGKTTSYMNVLVTDCKVNSSSRYEIKSIVRSHIAVSVFWWTFTRMHDMEWSCNQPGEK